MINRQITFLLLFLSMLALVLGSIGGTEELTKSSSETAIPPESVVVPYPIGENPKAGIVQKLFAHRRHAQEFRIACGECHHVYENGKNIWNECPFRSVQNAMMLRGKVKRISSPVFNLGFFWTIQAAPVATGKAKAIKTRKLFGFSRERCRTWGQRTTESNLENF